MGLFSKTTKTSSKENATTTPLLAPYATPAVTGYYGAVNDLFGAGGGGLPRGSYRDFITPTNAQQNAAFGKVLPGQNAALNTAINRTQNIGPSQFSYAPITTAGPAAQANTQQANAYYADTVEARTQRANAAQATAPDRGILGGATLGDPTKVDLNGLKSYAARQADTVEARTQRANAAQATAPDRGILGGATLGDPTKVDLNGLKSYAARQAEAGLQAGGASAAAGVASDYIQNYHPQADALLRQATLNEFDDQAGRSQAAYAAQAAGRGAFGGSRQAIGEAQLLSDMSRKRALTDAELADLAYTRAAGLAQGDAGNWTQANIASANNATQASVANANNSNAMNIANAGFANDLMKMQMSGDIQAALANAGYANQYDLAAFDAANQNNRLIYGTEADLGMFNTGQQNDINTFNAGQWNDTSRYNAGQMNAMNIANAGFANDLMKMQMSGDIQAALANAGYANQYDLAAFDAANQNNRLIYGTEADLGMFNTGQQNDINTFNAGQWNDTSRYNAGQMNAANQWNAGNQTQTGQFNAGQVNNANQFNAGQINNQSQYNAGLINQGDQFNAGQYNNWSLANQRLGLDAASQLGSLGVQQAANTRADATTNAELGGLLYNIERQNQLAPYTYLDAYGNALNPNGVLGITTGQEINSTSTGKNTQSGGLGSALLGGAFQLGSAALMASDIRVKRDIVKLGEEPDGLGLYRFNYVWDSADEGPRYGVMAQEVEQLRPWALGPVVEGVMTVNYGAL